MGDSLFYRGDDLEDDPHALNAWEAMQLVLPPVPDPPEEQKGSPLDYFCDRSPNLHLVMWDIGKEVQRFMDRVPKLGRGYRAVQWSDLNGMFLHKDRRYTLAYPLIEALEGLSEEDIVICPHMFMKGRPDVSALNWNKSCTLMAGVVERPEYLPRAEVQEMLQLPGSSVFFWATLNRLREEMILACAAYGFIHNGDGTWFVARIFPDETGQLAISAPVPRDKAILGYYWYLMYSALNLKLDGPQKHNLGEVLVFEGRHFDRLDVENRLKDLVCEAARSFPKFESSIGREELNFWWSFDQDFVPDTRSPHFSHLVSKRSSSILRLIYKQRSVVVKMRDLSNKEAPFEDNLKPFVREILAYKHLKAIQGDAIPELLEFGFTSGYLFGILVMSEGGTAVGGKPCLPATVSRKQFGDVAVAQLQKVHQLGLYHSDLDGTDLLQLTPSFTKLTIVSFSKACFVSELKSPRALSFELERVRVISGDFGVEDVSESESE